MKDGKEGAAYPPEADKAHDEDEELRRVFVREAIVHYRGQAIGLESPLRDPRHAVAFAKRTIQDHAREHFQAIYLDGRHRPIAHSVVSVGTATASLVHPREVFQLAVLSGAAAVLILHNHPSGDPRPSPEDREVVKRLGRAGRLLGIHLVDSIVWAHRSGRWVSMREEDPSGFDGPA
ncbi:MAG: JAB domain-containing protein [Myxococcota bacterium]